jgi:UDP-N-acetylmuramate dehydrogenase
MVLGGGSNVLAGDDGYRGVVVSLHDATRPLTVSETVVEVGAGRSLRALAGVSTSHNLSGPEFWVGIPGTIGGALAGNAGAHGAAICDFVTELEVADADGTGWAPMTDIPHSYRQCDLPSGSMVLAARFRFAPDDPEKIKARRIECIAQRRDSQPTGERSAGCVFRNPPGSSAGALLDNAGLKGFRRGGAEVSEKHANFIVNRGGATAGDVVGLIDEMRRRVEDETGIRLETEIRFVGVPKTTR